MNDVVRHETMAQVAPRVTLVQKMAAKYSVEPEKMLATLKATAFKVPEGEVTNEQMMALLVVADQYGLNPWTKEIFAFPDKKNGIVPVVGVDGWSRIINDHPQSDGFEFRASEKLVTLTDAQSCPEWMEVVIHRKDRSHPIIVREYLDEVYRPLGTYKDGNKHKPGPWQTHTKRFLRHKVLIQGARIAYGFGGIYEEDEAERILERDITPEALTPRVKMPMALPRSAEPVPENPPAATGELIEHEPQPPQPRTEPLNVSGMVGPGMLRLLNAKIAAGMAAMGDKAATVEMVCKEFGVPALESLPAAKINEAISYISNPPA